MLVLRQLEFVQTRLEAVEAVTKNVGWFIRLFRPATFYFVVDRTQKELLAKREKELAEASKKVEAKSKILRV